MLDTDLNTMETTVNNRNKVLAKMGPIVGTYVIKKPTGKGAASDGAESHVGKGSRAEGRSAGRELLCSPGR